MISVTVLIAVLSLSTVKGYYDPDLNYHLNKVQKLTTQPCADNGYSYPTPAVQLTTTGVKVAAAPTVLAQPTLQSYQYPNTGYLAGYTQVQAVPQNTYLPQPATAYQTASVLSQSNYVSAAASKEVHGYATSAGLSAVAAPMRTVIPQATYAQAPIIAKVTAAPLIAKFSASPAKTTFISSQNQLVAGSSRASLNSFGTVHTGGPVVSQVYAAPSASYATSQALKNQQPQLFTAARYTSYVTPTQYSQVGPVYAQSTAVGAQFGSSYISNAASATRYVNHASRYVNHASQYAAPAVTTHYRAPAQALSQVSQVAPVFPYQTPSRTQYAVPAVGHYAAPNVQYAAPVVTQHAVVPALVTQYNTHGATQYSGVVAQHQASNLGVVQHGVVPVHNAASLSATISAAAPARLTHAPVAAVKNLHTEFLENYDAHPRYSYEYSVHDPHTGDIKQQKEERDGEVVKGQYSLVEPDGSVRTVDYVADWETGFHADVRNSKDNQHKFV